MIFFPISRISDFRISRSSSSKFQDLRRRRGAELTSRRLVYS